MAVVNLKIPVGKEDFEEIRTAGSYYIDKSELIWELLEKMDNKVTLFTRPRRFGKTLMMSMMESFFDINRDSRGVFEGLSVMRHEDFCGRWMNQYPVLFLSFKDVDGESFEDAFNALKNMLADKCKMMTYLAESENVNSADVEIFNRIVYQQTDLADIKSSLKTLMRMMRMHFGKPVVLLIDEYDVPLAKASEKGYYSAMLDVIRGMFSLALKTNEFLKFAVITGCLRIAKESVFTGTNNFASYSVLDQRFSQYFGFVEEEVMQLLRVAGLEDRAETIRQWYDGYLFGNTELYCPWDVVNYVSNALAAPETAPKNYWKNTSHNGIIRTLVGREDFDVTEKFEILLNGGAITQTISDELTYDTLHASEDNLWSVLFMTGYLTKADKDSAGDTVAVKIPNREIASIFQDTVVAYFEQTLDRSRQLELMRALWNGEEERASEVISDLLWETISYNDYHEDYYHAFLAGIFVGLSYAIESNKERGLGRPNILLKDRKNRRVLVIEAKRSEKKSDMEKDCQAGIQQIINGEYARNLDGYTTVLCYGIAFFKKSALVRKMDA